ncbi:MAG: NAD(P)H-hydrate dehydratase [Elusimicrobiaceae bacterium]|nr:NAD(P)H-hydrate dehydratase [Elusimicrobiaceae bacterium]
MEILSQTQIKSWLPARPENAHKGLFGRVLIVAGSRSMCGAGFLCACSALTAGAGLVYWALPASMQPSFAAQLPEVITIPLAENATGEIAQSAWEFFPEFCKKYNPSLVILGPGMGESPLLPVLLENCALPLLVDADGLNALSRQAGWHRTWAQERPGILTPHPGEMARLLGQPVAADEKARQSQVETLAQLTGAVCLLKGAGTLISWANNSKLQTWKNPTGSSALAKAGAGDVLAGLIGGLWAQLGSAEGFSKHTAFKAAACGVYLHGLAGDLAAQEKGNFSVLARDVIAYLPRAFAVAEGK